MRRSLDINPVDPKSLAQITQNGRPNGERTVRGIGDVHTIYHHTSVWMPLKSEMFFEAQASAEQHNGDGIYTYM